jgi:8-amino-7-oxononanoate synthase
VPVLEDLRAELAELERLGLRRQPHVIEGPRRAEVRLDGRPILLFCSNDYLGLGADPRLVAAAHAALDEHGVGAGASRLISGTSPAHRAAEERIADFVRMPAALLFSTGYAANVGTLSTLLGRSDVAFSDRLNHASLIDGLRLSRATTHVYEHADVGHLERLLARHRRDGRRAWVVTDSIFSMDGDRAPLVALRALCDRYDAGLFVDDAHALGVIGEGRGLTHHLCVRPDVVVGTLGKAMGVAGAFAAGPHELRAVLESRARSYVFSTAPPPVLAATIRVAVDIVEGAHEERARLSGHARRLHAALTAQGWSVPSDGSTPILPVVVGEPAPTMQLSAALLARGFFVQGIRPPTVPPGTSRLRVVPTAGHTREHIDGLIAAFAALRGGA